MCLTWRDFLSASRAAHGTPIASRVETKTVARDPQTAVVVVAAAVCQDARAMEIAGGEREARARVRRAAIDLKAATIARFGVDVRPSRCTFACETSACAPNKRLKDQRGSKNAEEGSIEIDRTTQRSRRPTTTTTSDHETATNQRPRDSDQPATMTTNQRP